MLLCFITDLEIVSDEEHKLIGSTSGVLAQTSDSIFVKIYIT